MTKSVGNINKVVNTNVLTLFTLSRYITYFRSMRYRTSLGISIGIGLLEKIDLLRGDVSRSKYMERLIENNVSLQQEHNLQSEREVLTPRAQIAGAKLSNARRPYIVRMISKHVPQNKLSAITIPKCLTDNCKSCNGLYVDTLGLGITICCVCQCHRREN